MGLSGLQALWLTFEILKRTRVDGVSSLGAQKPPPSPRSAARRCSVAQQIPLGCRTGVCRLHLRNPDESLPEDRLGLGCHD